MKHTSVTMLNGHNLTVGELAFLARTPAARVGVSPLARKRLKRSRAVVEGILKQGKTAYGINTGFGRLADVPIAPGQIETLQKNLLISHAVGVGPSFSPEEVRAMLLLRIQSLLVGHSGVREEVVQALVKGFNDRVVPRVPEQGSCGASGDLAPLAHLMLPFIGAGEASIWGAREKRKARVKTIRLQAKEGLALINGTQAMTALGALACERMRILLTSADILGALSLDALMGTRTAFHPSIQAVRPHPGQIKSAANLWRLLEGSEILESHKDCSKVQDAYSLRCMPQVHGAARDAKDYVQGVIEREMNAATDNPLVFPDLPEAQQILSGGNFHGQPVAQALDFLALVATDFASISERRTERLLNPDLSELPAFLIRESGLHSGLMMVQVTAASLVSEAKALSFPASVDSIPTSANKEDHVSMGTTAARKLRQILCNVEAVLGIELLCAAQGLEFRRPLKSSAALEAVHRAFRKQVKLLTIDRLLKPDLDAAREFVASGELIECVEKFTGPLH